MSDPAEGGDIGARRAERREEPDRRGILGDGLLLPEEDEIVDLRALEVDRALERRGFDSDPGVAPSTAARLCIAFGEVGAGCAWGSGTCLPFSTLVLGGFAVGKYLFAAQVQPSRMSALSTTARIMFLLSFT